MPNQKVALNQRQRQQIKLSPQQELKIKILQLSNLQLIDKIQEEMLQNPVLEENDTATLQLPIVDPPTVKEYNKQEEINWEEFFESSRNSMMHEPATTEIKPLYDNIPTQQPTLREYLLQQLRMIPISNKEYEIGELIIDNINEDGYFHYSVDKIANEVKVSRAEVEKVLGKIQEFEPTGVGARDLKECLLIQVKDLGLEDSLTPLIENHLFAIQDKKYEQIAAQMNISIERVKELVEVIIKLLEPKPARLYENFQAPQVIPEIIISNTKEEGLKLEVNDEWIPSLRVNPYYQRLLKEKNLSATENEYIQKKMNAAVFFLKCIEDRKKTLRHVAKVIFDTQKEFLQEGILKLVPMKLEDIAKEVNLHLSTVSRAIANKFVKTPHGVHPLKFFFKTGMQTKEGGAISITTVKEKIKEIVAQENKQSPLSDNKIAVLLHQQGINIATRTVAKYRDELHIPSSFSRKESVISHKT
ncbi:MAG: RNA polymerase factor sigma-54 [bacterium]